MVGYNEERRRKLESISGSLNYWTIMGNAKKVAEWTAKRENFDATFVAKIDTTIDSYVTSKIAAGWTLEQVQSKVWLHFGLSTCIRKGVFYCPLMGGKFEAMYRRAA